MFIAHIRESDHEIQTVQSHLEAVADLARIYGESLGFGAHAELAGFLHDMGKFTTEFTEYLENSVIHEKVSLTKIDHSTAGAKYLYENFYNGNDLQKFVVEIVGMAILSHHSGLQNFVQVDVSTSDYIRRVVEKDLPYYKEVKDNFEAVIGNRTRVENLLEEAIQEFIAFANKVQLMESEKKKAKKHPYVYMNYAQKLVLSLLLDADRTDTRRFEEIDNTPLEKEAPFQTWYDTMMETIAKWEESTKPINLLRAEMSRTCDSMAEKPANIYTLSIPTGGGKTFASLRYALKHAALHGKKRIIYVVPYTTILEQNAKEVRGIIGDNHAVLEHHANVIDVTDNEEDYYGVPLQKKFQLGRDNWDHPIIFTTSVQFLNALFAKGTRNTRRMHRLTEAVIIFDEVQAIPYHHFALFNTAVNFLHHIGKSSVLLCTATQPTVAEMDYPIMIKQDAEMVPDLPNVVEAFERVQFHDYVSKEGWDAKEIANQVEVWMEDRQSMLIILNTKTAVRKLFEELKERELAKVYHLSTSMCPAHRSDMLAEIKGKLGKERIICVSTQLIEAGVDISFEAVVRSLAGLDSIAQAAGRCNRHAEREKGDVYIIKAADEKLDKLPEIKLGAEVTQNHILYGDTFTNALLSPDAIETYFSEFDNRAKNEILHKPRGLDYELIQMINADINHNQKTHSISTFKTLERYFEAITSPTTAVLVPYNRAAEALIADLNEELPLEELNKKLKEAQQYVVNVYAYELQQLEKENLLNPLYNEQLYVVAEQGYNEAYGLSLSGEGAFSGYQF